MSDRIRIRHADGRAYKVTWEAYERLYAAKGFEVAGKPAHAQETQDARVSGGDWAYKELTPEELANVEAGESEIASGAWVTLDELRTNIEPDESAGDNEQE